jgi:xanthine dehydrogenase YagS FAD-binding subunit
LCERTLPVADLLQPPIEARRTETVPDADELITAVRIPPLPAGARSAYLKAMDRKVWAFALVSAAAVLQIDNNHIAHARLVLGGAANVPHRAVEAERLLLNAEPFDDLFHRAADAALAGAQPLSDNGYKLPLAKALIRRALTSAAQQ